LEANNFVVPLMPLNWCDPAKLFGRSPASTTCAKMLGQNYFVEPNWHVLTFHPIFFCRATYGALVELLYVRICKGFRVNAMPT